MWIIIVIVACAAIFFYRHGEREFDKTRPPLSHKYRGLCNVMQTNMPSGRIWQDIDNKLVFGIRTNTGTCLISIRDTPDNRADVNYQIRDSASYQDYSINFTFSQHDCITSPEFVYNRINERIGQMPPRERQPSIHPTVKEDPTIGRKYEKLLRELISTGDRVEIIENTSDSITIKIFGTYGNSFLEVLETPMGISIIYTSVNSRNSSNNISIDRHFTKEECLDDSAEVGKIMRRAIAVERASREGFTEP